MQNSISIKLILRTPVNKNEELTVNLTDSIKDIKHKIQDQEGIPPDQQNLIFRTRTTLCNYREEVLEDNKYMNDYGIKEGSVIYLVLSLKMN